MPDISEVTTFLKRFGVSGSEAALYLKLLQIGPTTVSELANKAEIPRTTVHMNVEKLIAKGFISESVRNSKRILVAENPKKISILLTNQKIEFESKLEEISSLEQQVPQFIETIYSSIPKIDESTRIGVKYFQGKKGIKTIYQDAFSAKELRSYVNLGAVNRAFPENADMYIQIQKRRSSTIVKEIIDDSPESRRQAELFSEKDNFKFKITSLPINRAAIDILIFDEKVAMINFADPIVGSVLINRGYYESSKIIFDFIWETIPTL